LIELRQEETQQIDMATVERRRVMKQLNKLASRRLGIQSELAAFDSDNEEPLGKQLRELESRYNSVDEEISLLEEKLRGLRNQRRWLKDKMEDVQGKRDAGLSGFRGALRDVDSELSHLVRRPPIQPLDPAVFDRSDGALGEQAASSGGVEFLQLIPERRTPEMAKSWWEAELEILEKRRTQVSEERKALEEGAVVWDHVIALVSDFESELRRVLQGGTPSTAQSSTKGKEKALSANDLILAQLQSMNAVLGELEEAMRQAEDHSWNLLICAIGAELEAFRKAQEVLHELLSVPDLEREDEEKDMSGTAGAHHGADLSAPACEETGGDVPQDLLVSRPDELDRSGLEKWTEDGAEILDLGRDRPQSQDSENEVPLEFLAEHG
jgi:hypothetical protein